MMRIVEREVEGIVDASICPLDANVSRHCLRASEEGERHVDQVWRQVVIDARARLHILAPGILLQVRTEAIVVGFEQYDVAKVTGIENLLGGDEVAVKPTVVINGEQ